MVTVYLEFNRIWEAFFGRPLSEKPASAGQCCGEFGRSVGGGFGGGGLVCQFKSPRSCVYLVLPAGKDTGLGLLCDVEQ